VPTYRYTPTSEAAKAVGVELLRVSAIYENSVLPHGYGAERMAVVASVVRARRLFQCGYDLADAGNGLEAAPLLRAVFETALVLGWLKVDSELAFLIWMLDDRRSALRDHEAVRRSMRSERAKTRRQGGKVPSLAPGMTLGLLTRSNLSRYRRIAADLESQIRALPHLPRRLKRLRPTSYPNEARAISTSLVDRLPAWRELAKVARLEGVFHVVYPFESRSAVHLYPLGLEQFLEVGDAGVIVHSEPQSNRPDPYPVGAALFALVLEQASEQLTDFDLQNETARLVPQLAGLKLVNEIDDSDESGAG
jgi:Family of unknown function (DUF5677)